MSSEIEQILFFLARNRKLPKILGGNDHMAGRTSHHAFACAFERLALGPGNIEKPLPGCSGHFLVEGSIRLEEPHQGHVQAGSCASAA